MTRARTIATPAKFYAVAACLELIASTCFWAKGSLDVACLTLGMGLAFATAAYLSWEQPR